MTENEQHLLDQVNKLTKQRDALLEITWLDLPGEPFETPEQWREHFNKGWVRRDLADFAMPSPNQASPSSLPRRRNLLRVESDGTPANTNVFGPRGERIEGVIEVNMRVENNRTPQAEILVEISNERVEETALLGLATTGDLLNELRARAEVGGTLNYRTVDKN